MSFFTCKLHRARALSRAFCTCILHRNHQSTVQIVTYLLTTWDIFLAISLHQQLSFIQAEYTFKIIFMWFDRILINLFWDVIIYHLPEFPRLLQVSYLWSYISVEMTHWLIQMPPTVNINVSIQFYFATANKTWYACDRKLQLYGFELRYRL